MTDEAKAEKIAELEAARDARIANRKINDFKAVLKTAEGRRFVWEMLTNGGIFQLSFTGDNNSTNFNDGKKCVALGLFNDLLAVKPEAYLQMTLEHTSEAKEFEMEKRRIMEDGE